MPAEFFSAPQVVVPADVLQIVEEEADHQTVAAHQTVDVPQTVVVMAVGLQGFFAEYVGDVAAEADVESFVENGFVLVHDLHSYRSVVTNAPGYSPPGPVSYKDDHST